MPKFYRFRATTPERPERKGRRKERDVEGENSATTNSWVDFLTTTPTLSWYMRRTAWREPTCGPALSVLAVASTTNRVLTFKTLKTKLKTTLQSLQTTLKTKDILRQV